MKDPAWTQLFWRIRDWFIAVKIYGTEVLWRARRKKSPLEEKSALRSAWNAGEGRTHTQWQPNDNIGDGLVAPRKPFLGWAPDSEAVMSIRSPAFHDPTMESVWSQSSRRRIPMGAPQARRDASGESWCKNNRGRGAEEESIDHGWAGLGLPFMK